MLPIEVIILALILAAWWWYRKVTKDSNKFLEKFPGSPGLPLLGNALELNSTSKVLDTLTRYMVEFGGKVRIRIGPFRNIIMITDYKMLEFVMGSTKVLNKSDDYNALKPWLGTGLLTADGPKWTKHRKMLTPAFHFQILEQYLNVFESAGDTFIEKLEEAQSKDLDIYPLVTLCTLDVICESAMGTKINAQKNKESDYVKSVKEMCRIAMERGLSPIEMYDTLFPLTKNYYAQKRSLGVLHKHTNDVINRRRSENVQSSGKAVDDVGMGIKKKKAFLDLLLEVRMYGEPLPHESIREEVDTFMFEGHDTTASAISFAFFCLANHPEVQDLALEEQKTIFGGNLNPAQVSYNDLQDMKYLELVIKETLRLYPSVPFYLRKTHQDLVYEEEVIPKNTTFGIFAFGVHRNPKYFSDPETFDPMRFSDYDGKSPYAYIPFSAGPRNCIGQKFAMLEMKSTISKVLRRFELTPAFPKHKLVLIAEAILKSANGIRIGLKPRQ